MTHNCDANPKEDNPISLVTRLNASIGHFNISTFQLVPSANQSRFFPTLSTLVKYIAIRIASFRTLFHNEHAQ